MYPSLPCHPPSNWLKLFLSQTLSQMDNPTILKLVIIYFLAYEDGTDKSVPKRRHIKFRRRVITQKNTTCKYYFNICSWL
jgi:hypothetical protein